MPLPHDPGPHWGEVGIHGLHRQREWDALATVDAPAFTGDESWFVVLADGRLIVEEGDDDPSVLVGAIELLRPYRAHGVRRSPRLWVVAASRIETAHLAEDPGGDSVELAWDGLERTVRIDGRPTLIGVPELERRAAARYDQWVVSGRRLESDVWEVAISPL